MNAIKEKKSISSVALLFAHDGGDKASAILALASKAFERPPQSEGDHNEALI
jgi:hypothetical protein